MEDISVIFKRKKSLRNIFLFFSKLYYSEKIVELVSFFIWEIKYRLSLYSTSEILQFTSKDSLHSIDRNMTFDGMKTDKFLISPCNHNWSILYFDSALNTWGCTFEDNTLLLLLSPDNTLKATFKFDSKIEGLFIDSLDNVFCCAEGFLYRSTYQNEFKKVLEFSTPESRFRKEAFTEDAKGRLFIGEYANILEGKRWKFIGHIYYSEDNGKSWANTDFLSRAKVNKHVHVIKWSKLVNGLIMTDGDNQKNIWVNTSDGVFDKFSPDATSGWNKLNKNHLQKGGYTAIVEVRDKILFGTDYNGGSNFLVSTSNMLNFDSKIVPDPYRRAVFDRIVMRKNAEDKLEMWTSLVFGNGKSVKSLLMLSYDFGDTWEKIIEYDGTQLDLRIIGMSNTVQKKIYMTFKNRNGLGAKAMCIHS